MEKFWKNQNLNEKFHFCYITKNENFHLNFDFFQIFPKIFFQILKFIFFDEKKMSDKKFFSLSRCKFFWRIHFSHPRSDLTSISWRNLVLKKKITILSSTLPPYAHLPPSEILLKFTSVRITFCVVTFHSGEVRIFPAAENKVQTCPEPTKPIAAISEQFESSKTQGQKNIYSYFT